MGGDGETITKVTRGICIHTLEGYHILTDDAPSRHRGGGGGEGGNSLLPQCHPLLSQSLLAARFKREKVSSGFNCSLSDTLSPATSP